MGQVLLVAESLLGEGRGHGVGVAALALIRTGVDDGAGDVVLHLFNISMVRDILHRRSVDIAAADDTHLMDVRQDVFPHALLHLLTVIATYTTPVLGGETGSNDRA